MRTSKILFRALEVCVALFSRKIAFLVPSPTFFRQAFAMSRSEAQLAMRPDALVAVARSRSTLPDALKWYEAASNRKHVPSMVDAATGFAKLGEHKKALKYWKKAAQAGSDIALYELGVLFQGKNTTKAGFLFLQSAKKGRHVSAMYNLGRLLEEEAEALPSSRKGGKRKRAGGAQKSIFDLVQKELTSGGEDLNLFLTRDASLGTTDKGEGAATTLGGVGEQEEKENEEANAGIESSAGKSKRSGNKKLHEEAEDVDSVDLSATEKWATPEMALAIRLFGNACRAGKRYRDDAYCAIEQNRCEIRGAQERDNSGFAPTGENAGDGRTYASLFTKQSSSTPHHEIGDDQVENDTITKQANATVVPHQTGSSWSASLSSLVEAGGSLAAGAMGSIGSTAASFDAGWDDPEEDEEEGENEKNSQRLLVGDFFANMTDAEYKAFVRKYSSKAAEPEHPRFIVPSSHPNWPRIRQTAIQTGSRACYTLGRIHLAEFDRLADGAGVGGGGATTTARPPPAGEGGSTPLHGAIYSEEAITSSILSRPKEIARLFVKAVDLDSQNAKAAYNAAILYYSESEKKLAYKYGRMAAESGLVEGMRMLATMFGQDGKQKLANKWRRKAAEAEAERKAAAAAEAGEAAGAAPEQNENHNNAIKQEDEQLYEDPYPRVEKQSSLQRSSNSKHSRRATASNSGSRRENERSTKKTSSKPNERATTSPKQRRKQKKNSSQHIPKAPRRSDL